MPFDMITILGPTASGKTDLAAHLAVSLGNCEIISADSRQVYKHMDIGTGKDLKDYVVNGTAVPYHLIDICEPGRISNRHTTISRTEARCPSYVVALDFISKLY